MSSEPKKENSYRQAFAPFAAGITGGTVSTALLLPIDNVKVRLQVYEGESQKPSGNGNHPQQRLGFLRVMRGVVRHEGVAGLYQGITPAVIGSAVSWGGFFFVYEGCKKELRHQRAGPDAANYHLTPIDNFVLACSSGAIMVALTNPIWLIKTRMQLQMKHAAEEVHASVKPYNGIFDAVRTIVREEGFPALYKGSGPALLLTSHGGVQFVVYEFLRKHFHFARARRNKAKEERDTVMDRLEKSAGYLTMGAIAKVTASTVTYPIQVLKARLQQRSESVELTAEGNVRVVKRNYTSMVSAVQQVWQKEGFSGFFKGCIPNAIRVAPSSAITFVVYESTLDFLSEDK
eukprot:Nitzschia sp. Nitz4//scaffold62_size106224//18990//20103//NITZ4_004344-RA/size106224-augustus-gene-0.100-mRNA-1//-1//CDS//3329555820//2043//frame0